MRNADSTKTGIPQMQRTRCWFVNSCMRSQLFSQCAGTILHAEGLTQAIIHTLYRIRYSRRVEIYALTTLISQVRSHGWHRMLQWYKAFIITKTLSPGDGKNDLRQALIFRLSQLARSRRKASRFGPGFAMQSGSSRRRL